MAAIIAKFCAERKQHFAPPVRNALRMPQTDINQVVARALRWHMDSAGITEKDLGAKAGVSARTVANFLRPHNRVAGARGKEPSGKLTELALIAQALKVPIEDLVTDLDETQREERRRLAMAAQVLRTGAIEPQGPSRKRRANGE